MSIKNIFKYKLFQRSIVFVGCNMGYSYYNSSTSESTPNLPSTAVNKGATTAVAFPGTIWRGEVDQWLPGFFELLYEGETVEEACNALRYILPSVATTSIGDDEDEYDPDKDGVANCVIYGNRDLTLN